MNKRKYYLLIGLGLCLLVVVFFVAQFFRTRFDVAEEQRLFEKYSQDSQYSIFTDMIKNDRKDLADSSITKYKKVAATMDMGLAWYNLREYKFAALWWEKGLDIEPNNIIGWYNLGNAYLELKDYSEAESAYEESMEIARPGEIDGCLALGELYKYAYTSKKDKEPEVYLTCLKKHENNRDLLARLAGYYRDIGDRGNAIIYFDKLWGVDPSPEVSAELEKLRVNNITQ